MKNCPLCAELIQNKAIMCRYCRRGLSADYFYCCPYCAEMIRHKAILCRYCLSDIADSNPEQGAPVPIHPGPPDLSGEVALALPSSEEDGNFDATVSETSSDQQSGTP